MSEQAMQVPLVELLGSVPHDARLVIEDGPYSTTYIPVGRYCHEAAAALSTHHAAPGVPQKEASGDKPFAYWVYVRAEQRGEFVHDLDDAMDDLTNCECEITELFERAAATAPAGGVPYKHIDPNCEDVSLLWAEIHHLRAAVQGPDGFATWQEAATDERIRRVKAESALTTAARAAEPKTLHAKIKALADDPAVQAALAAMGVKLVEYPSYPTPPTGTSKEGGEPA